MPSDQVVLCLNGQCLWGYLANVKYQKRLASTMYEHPKMCVRDELLHFHRLLLFVGNIKPSSFQ